MSEQFAVVGGGVSGMAAAHVLRQRGIPVEVLDLGSQLGGRVNPTMLGDRVVDLGGKNVGRKYRLFREFAGAFGQDTYDYFGTSTSRIEDGELVKFDGEKRVRAILGWARKASLVDLARFGQMLMHVKRHPQDGFTGSAYFDRFGDRRVSEYFRPELCRNAIRFLTVRMNGAEPDEYFMRNFGSNLGLATDTIEQLRNGMKPLIDAFAAKVPVRLNARVTNLLVERGRVVGLEMVGPDGIAIERRYTGVLLATQAWPSAELVEPHSPLLASQLRAVSYHSVAIVVAEYAKDVFLPDLRAVTFDDSNAISNAGAYGVDDLKTVRYTFSGRGARPLLARQLDGESLVRQAEAVLSAYLPVNERDRVRFVAKQYALGLCAQSPDRRELARVMSEELAKVSGLYLTGDYLRGASLEACCRAASECASSIRLPAGIGASNA